MSSENACPTVPPLYTWDSGTKEKRGTVSGTRAGQVSLKALARAFWLVPPERDKTGQEAGQSKNLVSRPGNPVGQKTAHNSPQCEEKLSLEKYDPTPEQIAHARRMLVDCPATRGKRHCWHCSRCGDARKCSAWRARAAYVESFRQSEKPYSLFLVESGAVEVIQ